jgi:methyl-accepting chemotaxis protein
VPSWVWLFYDQCADVHHHRGIGGAPDRRDPTTRDIIEVEWVKTEAANTLSSIALANGRRTVQQLVSAPAERQALRNEITEGRERFIAAFKLLSEQVKRPEARELLKKAEAARGLYVESQKRFYELLDAGQEDAARQEMLGTTLVQLGLVQQNADAPGPD